MSGRYAALKRTQIDAWWEEIAILKHVLGGLPVALVRPENSRLVSDCPIPLMGRSILAVLHAPAAIILLEFRVAERQATFAARDQMWDFALDLENFHEPSHAPPVAPMLVLIGALFRLGVYVTGAQW